MVREPPAKRMCTGSIPVPTLDILFYGATGAHLILVQKIVVQIHVVKFGDCCAFVGLTCHRGVGEGVFNYRYFFVFRSRENGTQAFNIKALVPDLIREHL